MYKDFNKTAKDCCDAGSPLEFSYKFKSKSANGCKFEASQVKTTAGKKKGQSSTFAVKNMGPWFGMSFDEMAVVSCGGEDYTGYTKWSNANLIPDCKIKAQLDHDWDGASKFSPNGAMGVLPSTIKMTAEYKAGPIKAQVNAKTPFNMDVGRTTSYAADAVFNMGDANVGAMVKGKFGKKQDMEYNVAAKYSMGDLSGVFHTEGTFNTLFFSIHNRCSDKFSVATISKYDQTKKSLNQTVGGQFSIDGDSDAAFNLNFENLMAPTLDTANLTGSYSRSSAYGAFGLVAQLQLDGAKMPHWGVNFETN